MTLDFCFIFTYNNKNLPNNHFNIQLNFLFHELFSFAKRRSIIRDEVIITNGTVKINIVIIFRFKIECIIFKIC